MRDQAQGLREELALVKRFDRIVREWEKWQYRSVTSKDWGTRIKAERLGKLADRAFAKLEKWRGENG